MNFLAWMEDLCRRWYAIREERPDGATAAELEIRVDEIDARITVLESRLGIIGQLEDNQDVARLH